MPICAKTLADHGAPLAFASDWPVTDVSVMRGIQAALTRVPYEGAQDERVGLMEVLRAYTAGGAWAAHLEGLTGTLRAGAGGRSGADRRRYRGDSGRPDWARRESP